MTVGENLRTLRKNAGLSQAMLAEKLYVTPQAISRWENGETEPDLQTVEKLAEIFHTSTDFIIHGDESTVRNPKAVLAEKSYHLYCLVGSTIMIIFAISFIAYTIANGWVNAMAIVYVLTSLLFLILVLVFEIRNRRYNSPSAKEYGKDKIKKKEKKS